MKTMVWSCLLLLLTGCRVIGPPEAPSPSGDPETSVRLGEKILQAIRDDDAEGFAAVFPELPKPEAEAAFRTSRKAFVRQFGQLAGFRFLTELRTPLMRNLVFRVDCRKTGKTGMEVEQQLLFRLLTRTENGRTGVAGMGFL